jgi:hypothetical protein
MASYFTLDHLQKNPIGALLLIIYTPSFESNTHKARSGFPSAKRLRTHLFYPLSRLNIHQSEIPLPIQSKNDNLCLVFRGTLDKILIIDLFCDTVRVLAG